MKTFLRALSCCLFILLAAKTRASDQDTTRIKELFDLGYQYEQSNKDSAILIYQKALSICIATNYDLGTIQAHRYLGIVFSEQARYSEAIISYEKSIALAKQMNKKDEEAKGLLNLGNVYYHQGIYTECLQNYIEAARIFEAKGDSSRLSTLYTNMGSLYYEVKDYEESENYHRLSMRLAESMRDSSNILASNINLGSTLLIKGNLDSAEIHFQRSLTLAKRLNDLRRVYSALNNLASVYGHQEKYEKALQFGLDALQWARKTEEPELISSAQLSCGLHHSNLGNFAEALKYLNEGLRISEDNKILPNLAGGYEWRFQVYLKMGRIAEAQRDYDLTITYEDSIRNAEKFQEIGQIEGKYELEKEIREKELEEAKQAQEMQLMRDRRDRIQYFSIVLILIALFIGIKLVSNFNMPVKASHLVTFISVLLFFEFLLVILDPLIDNWSGSVPVYKLLINLLLAVMISPFHNWLLKILPKSKIANGQALKEV